MLIRITRYLLLFAAAVLMLSHYQSPAAASDGMLTAETEAMFRAQLKKAGAGDALIDLNVRVVIPKSKNPHEEADTSLWATIIRPKRSLTEKVPTILVATPYRREMIGLLYTTLVAHDYAYVVLDLRGTGSSSGTWQSFDLVEQYDVKYVVDDFIPAFGWSDGNVGMIGPSYMGIIQMLTAGICDLDPISGEPVHLKAIFPVVPMADAYLDIVMHNGNVDLAFIPMWMGVVDILGLMPSLLKLGENEVPNPDDIQEAADTWRAHWNHLPTSIGWIMDAEHRKDGEFYDRRSPMIYWPEKPDGGWGFFEGDSKTISSKLPVFLVGGWFDIFTRGTLNNYQHGLVNHVPGDKAMIVGEWYHIDGSMVMGINPMLTCALPARWFDWKIKGKADCFMQDFPVLLYVMGEKRWRAEKSWPLPASRVEERTMYLSKKISQSIEGDWFTEKEGNQIYSLVAELSDDDLEGTNPSYFHSGELLVLHGTGSRSNVRWGAGSNALFSQVKKFYFGANVDASMDYEDERDDDWGIPTFTSEPLENDLEIAGPLTVTFWARTEFSQDVAQERIDKVSAAIKSMLGIDANLIIDAMVERDVQWIAELDDVFPEGRARNITSGWLRASHRFYDPDEPLDAVEHAIDPNYVPFDPFYDRPDRDPRSINENELYQYVIELWPTCNVFKKGHRIRVTLSNSDFPHLLPILRPSTNTIVIDEDHKASISFKAVNTSGEGSTWKWIDGVNSYLLHDTDEPGSGDGDGSDINANTSISKDRPGSSVGGCGSYAEASTRSGNTPMLPGVMGVMGLMLIPFGMITLHRRIRRRK